jgi:hypothetical protein
VNGVDQLSDEARRLVDEAAEQKIVLRVIGSVAMQLHCEPSSEHMVQRERVPKDIDLVGRKRDRSRLTNFFEAQGYETDRDMLVAMEGTRYLFRNKATGIDVDLWVDELNLCHRLDVRRRMGEGPTLPIEDLLLSKLQIVELTSGDVSDITCMLDTHELAELSDDPEVISLSYLTGVLGADWGFWRTATGNIESLKPLVGEAAAGRLDTVAEAIETAPKTTGWKLRAMVGERKQWWQDVDIPRDTY